MAKWKINKGYLITHNKATNVRAWLLFLVECAILVAIVYYAYETNKLRVATESLVNAAIAEIKESKKTRIATEEYTRATKELLEVQKDYIDETYRMRLNAEKGTKLRDYQFRLSVEPELYGAVMFGYAGEVQYLKWYQDSIDDSYVDVGETPNEKYAEKLGGLWHYIKVFNPTDNNALKVMAFSYEPIDHVFYCSLYSANYVQPNQNHCFLITNRGLSRADLVNEFQKLYDCEEAELLVSDPWISTEEEEPYFLIIYADVQDNLFINRTFWIYDADANILLNKQIGIRRVSR